jgi:hypothetical protein
MPKLNVEIDAGEVVRELDRIAKGPGPYTYMSFEDAFSEAFNIVHEDIHIETGSLFSTGKLDTRFEGDFVWEGTIRFGGAAPGMPRDPAYYGVYELARGGDHFFFEAAHRIIPKDMVSFTLQWMGDGEK